MRRPIRKSDLSKRAGRIHEAMALGAPELITDADLAYNRATRPARKKPIQTERTEVQRPLVNYLRKHLPAGSVVYAITNHARSKMQILALARDGMQAGMTDLGICIAGRSMVPPRPYPFACFIECKRPNGGTLSDNQTYTQGMLEDMGFPVLKECRSVEEGLVWLRELGVAI